MKASDIHGRQQAIRQRWSELDPHRIEVERQKLAFDRAVDTWHDTPTLTCSLPQYLGLTADEYRAWVGGDGIPARWRGPDPQFAVTTTSLEKEKKMTTVALPTAPVDADGYVDLSTMRLQYEHLRDLLDKREKLDEAIAHYEKQLAEAVLAVPGGRGFSIDGVRRVTYRRNGTFAGARFAAENPHIAAAYQTTKSVLDVEALRRHNPDLYEQYRSYRFVHVMPKG